VSGVYRNFESIEGTADGEELITLVRKSRKLMITNDSGSESLLYKFNSSEGYGTLKPTESLSMHFVTDTIYINGTGDYRIWVYG